MTHMRKGLTFYETWSEIISEYELQNRLTDSINSIKNENGLLKTPNDDLKSEIVSLNSKFEILESYSRRNNLRINGIEVHKTKNGVWWN